MYKETQFGTTGSAMKWSISTAYYSDMQWSNRLEQQWRLVTQHRCSLLRRRMVTEKTIEMEWSTQDQCCWHVSTPHLKQGDQWCCRVHRGLKGFKVAAQLLLLVVVMQYVSATRVSSVLLLKQQILLNTYCMLSANHITAAPMFEVLSVLLLICLQENELPLVYLLIFCDLFLIRFDTSL